MAQSQEGSPNSLRQLDDQLGSGRCSQRSLWPDAWNHMIRNRLSLAGQVIFFGVFFLAIFGP